MRIDLGKLYSAVEEHADGPQDTGFLNKRTGEIVFVPDNEGQHAAWCGEDVAVDAVFDRAAVEANPSEWLEIPKIPGHPACHDIDRDEHIRDFLREHGIEPELA